MKPFFIGLFIGVLVGFFLAAFPVRAQLRIFTPPQGATGIGSATAGDVGNCLKVLDDNPFTYELGSCGGSAFPFTAFSAYNATSTPIAFTAGLISNGSTTIAGLSSGLVGNNNGKLYNFASSSLFGYVPVAPTRAVNTTFPLQGGGTLAGDLTLTNAFSTTTNTGMSAGNLYIGSGGIMQTSASSSIFGYTPEQPLTFSFPLQRSVNAISSLFSTTTNTGMTAGFNYIGSGGIMQTGASSTFFGYTPLNPTRSLTMSSGNGQITLSAGAQDLSADRTWTFNYTGLATSTTLTNSNLLVSNGLAGVYGVATTTVTCSGIVSCTQFTTLGSAPITITANAGTGSLSTTSPVSAGNLLVYSSTGAGSAFGVATSTLTASSPLTGSFTQIGTGGTLGCTTASSGVAGCLNTVDWATFNNKISSTSLSASFPLAYNSSTGAFTSSFSTTTNTGMSAGNLYIGSGGIMQTTASSSIFGFLPIGWGQATSTNPNQIVYTDALGKLVSVASSSLSLPNTALQNSSITINGSSIALGGSVTVASTTLLADSSTFSGLLNRFTNGSTSNATTSSTQYFGAAAVPFSSLLRTDSTGKLSAVTIGSNLSFDGTTLSATASGGSYPFTPSTWGAFSTSATSTKIQGTVGFIASSTSYFDAINIGSTTPTTFFAAPLQVIGTSTQGLQAVIQNMATGTTAYGQLSIHASGATDSTYYHEIGINNQGYSQATQSAENQYDAYNIASDAGLVIGTASSTNSLADLRFVTGGVASTSIRMVLRKNGLIAIGTTSPLMSALTIASSTGQQLQLADGFGTPWNFRARNGNFYLASSTITSNTATSSVPAFTIAVGGFQGLVGLATSSPIARLAVDTTNAVSGWMFAIGSSVRTFLHTTWGGQTTTCETKVATSSVTTIDWEGTCNKVIVGIGPAAMTLQFKNATTSKEVGGNKLIQVCNPTQTAGALTWKDVEWAGATVPTQTTTANVCDLYSIVITSATSTTNGTTATYKMFGGGSTGYQ